MHIPKHSNKPVYVWIYVQPWSPWFPPAWHMVTTSNPITARRLSGNRDRFASRLLPRFQPAASTNHSVSIARSHPGFPLICRGAFPTKKRGQPTLLGPLQKHISILTFPMRASMYRSRNIRAMASSHNKRSIGSQLPHEPLSIPPTRSMRVHNETLLRFSPSAFRVWGSHLLWVCLTQSLRPQVFSTSRRFTPPQTVTSLFQLDDTHGVLTRPNRVVA